MENGKKMQKQQAKIAEQIFDTHMIDPDNKFDLGKAKKGCKNCYGTGVAARMPMLGGVRLVCKCVAKRTREDEELLNKK